MKTTLPLHRHAKLALSHLAYLRALAQGVQGFEAAQRYLSLGHGHEFAPLHAWVIALARAVARRAGLSAWRLLGVELSLSSRNLGLPSLEDWVDTQGLSDWSQAEQLEMYAQAFAGVQEEPQATRKAARAARLIQRRLSMLRMLEAANTADASLADPIDAWFGGSIAQRLAGAGITTLGSLAHKINTGGRWWAHIPAIGPGKVLSQ